MLRDLRYALRQRFTSPGFGIAAMATLKPGLEANSPVLGARGAILLRVLPISHPEGLYRIPH